MIIVAYDIGDKRIGITCTDALEMMALPVETYYRKGTAADIKYLADFAKSRGAGLIVCGLPYNFDGSESLQSAKTREFADLLSKATDIPVELQDERFTTLEATRVLLSADVGRAKRKQLVDKIAASYILEAYMARKKQGV